MTEQNRQNRTTNQQLAQTDSSKIIMIVNYSPARMNNFQTDHLDRFKKIRQIFLTDHYSSTRMNNTLIDFQTDSSEVTL